MYPEKFGPNGPIIYQSENVYPIGQDSIMLAAFARPKRRDTILDIGCGCGILGILLTAGLGDRTLLAVDISPEAAELTQQNINANHMQSRARSICADIRRYKAFLASGVFDCIICNPPYFRAGSGKEAPGNRSSARSDGLLSLEELCACARYALRFGGHFYISLRPERLTEWFAALETASLTPKRLQPVHHNAGQPAYLLLLDCVSGGKPGLAWEKDFFVFSADGQETAAYRSICEGEMFHCQPEN